MNKLERDKVQIRVRQVLGRIDRISQQIGQPECRADNLIVVALDEARRALAKVTVPTKESP